VLGHLLRRVRDTFAAGAAERRFRQLESDTRELLHEIDATLEKLAIRAATNAKRRARATRRDLQEETDGPVPTVEATTPHDRKAAIRARLAARGTAIHQITRAQGE
jgi:DNA anti-recombination protein RmuC